MINADMRDHSYFLFTESNEYGQPALTEDVQGTVKMAIYSTTQAIQDNINYNGAQYIGITNDKHINDKYVIAYNDTMLKVLYIQSTGRFVQVFMGSM